MIKSSTLNRILNKYSSILVEIVTVPNVANRKVISVQSFKDLLNIKDKKNKPIYYLNTPFTCEFLFIDKDIYVYTVKESSYNNSVFDKGKGRGTDLDIISNIERNTYIKCTDGSEYLITPIDDLDNVEDVIADELIFPIEKKNN
ncbi:MAG: DUF5305 domain-containing protein [Bacilli bacterium]|nr:DUF5305 domain-containing protein [Bacilli bacterium]